MTYDPLVVSLDKFLISDTNVSPNFTMYYIGGTRGSIYFEKFPFEYLTAKNFKRNLLASSDEYF